MTETLVPLILATNHPETVSTHQRHAHAHQEMLHFVTQLPDNVTTILHADLPQIANLDKSVTPKKDATLQLNKLFQNIIQFLFK